MKTLPKSVLLGQAWPTLAQPKSFHILTQPTGPARTFPRFPILVTNTSTLLKFSIRYQSQVSNWIGEFFKLGLAVIQICGGIQFNHVQRSRVTDLSGIGNERPHPGEQVSREAEEYLQNRRRFEQELRIGSRNRRRDAETREGDVGARPEAPDRAEAACAGGKVYRSGVYGRRDRRETRWGEEVSF